ncbi:MAG TPA: hypothetical protein VIF57_05300 [Polyangia bacterium]
MRRAVLLALGLLWLQSTAARADEAPIKPGECAAGAPCDVAEPGAHAAPPVAAPEAASGAAAASPAAAGKPAGQLEMPAAVAAVPPPAKDGFATIGFRNDVGKKLRLVEARFIVDGGAAHTVVGPEPGKSYVIFSGETKPGPHTVTTRLVYQGDRRVFSYMNGFTINVEADQVLVAPPNRPVNFTIVGAENRGMTVPLDRRLQVKVEEGAPAR